MVLQFAVTKKIKVCIEELLDYLIILSSSSKSKQISISDTEKEQFEQILKQAKEMDGKQKQLPSDSDLKMTATISFDAVRRLSSLLKEIPEDSLTYPSSKWTHELLDGSEVVSESNLRSVSAQYEQFMFRAKARYSDLQYDKMTNDIRAEKKWNVGLSQLKDLNSQLSLGLNIIVTMISAFAAGYFVVIYSSGDTILVMN